MKSDFSVEVSDSFLCFRLNIFTSKILNLLLPLGGVSREPWILIYPFLLLIDCNDCFAFLFLFSLFFFWLFLFFCILKKKCNPNLINIRRRTNLKYRFENASALVSFIYVKRTQREDEVRRKEALELVEFSRYN